MGQITAICAAPSDDMQPAIASSNIKAQLFIFSKIMSFLFGESGIKLCKRALS